MADIPAAQIETVVQEVGDSALPRDALRKMLAAYNPTYDPTPEPWTRFQVKCSADGRAQLESIFDDLAKIAGIDRTEPGSNDTLIALLHARWFQGQEEGEE